MKSGMYRRNLIRILHFPTLTGANPYGMRTADRSLGFISDCVAIKPSPFKYAADKIISFRDNDFIGSIRVLLFFLKSIFRYHVFVFNYGSSFFPRRSDYLSSERGILRSFKEFAKAFLEGLDLFVLKKLKKKIVFVFQGSDVRPNIYTASLLDMIDSSNIEKLKANDFFSRRWVKIVDKYSDAIYYLNPDLGRWLPTRATFIPYSHVNFRDHHFSGLSTGKYFRIAHAPSHRGIKGTQVVLQVIDRLTSAGLKFEFDLIENVPNPIAWERYKKADLVVDQLKIGWYGGLAVEAMALGKPVVCFIDDNDLQFVDPALIVDLPLIRADASSLYSVLFRILSSPKSHLEEIAMRSRTFVEKWHDPLKIEVKLLNELGLF